MIAIILYCTYYIYFILKYICKKLYTMSHHCEDKNCTLNKYFVEQIKSLNKPITGEFEDDVITLIRDGEVIGIIPNNSNYTLLNAFGNPIQEE